MHIVDLSPAPTYRPGTAGNTTVFPRKPPPKPKASQLNSTGVGLEGESPPSPSTARGESGGAASSGSDAALEGGRHAATTQHLHGALGVQSSTSIQGRGAEERTQRAG